MRKLVLVLLVLSLGVNINGQGFKTMTYSDESGTFNGIKLIGLIGNIEKPHDVHKATITIIDTGRSVQIKVKSDKGITIDGWSSGSVEVIGELGMVLSNNEIGWFGRDNYYKAIRFFKLNRIDRITVMNNEYFFSYKKR